MEMSYRIYVNDFQCLGNNVCPQVLIEELKKQGCEIDADNCFENFEIKEIQPIIEALEKYVFSVYEEKIRRGINICDFQKEFEQYKNSKFFTNYMEVLADTAYIFTTTNFLRYIKDDVEEIWNEENAKIEYKIKKGHSVSMSGF